jgi:hypothetical protein
MRRLLQDPRHRCDCVWKLTRLTVCASANQERREGFVALRAILATPLRLLAHTCPLMVLYQWRGSRRWFPSCVNVVESRYEVMSFPVQAADCQTRDIQTSTSYLGLEGWNLEVHHGLWPSHNRRPLTPILLPHRRDAGTSAFVRPAICTWQAYEMTRSNTIFDERDIHWSKLSVCLWVF